MVSSFTRGMFYEVIWHIIVSPEGLKLTYMNVGSLMKSQSLAIWLAMSGLGSLFVLIVTKATADFTMFNEFNTVRARLNPDKGISLPMKYAFYTSICFLANVWFILWSRFVFEYKDESSSMSKVVGSESAAGAGHISSGEQENVEFLELKNIKDK